MANPYFNAVYYLQNNPDLMAAGVTAATAWDHYVQYGANEAYAAGGSVRAPNDWFDARAYLNGNPDLIAAGVTPANALDHFQAYGANELRSPNAQIAASPITAASLVAYVNANADIATALSITIPATTLTAAQQNAVVAQFYGYGINESRPSAPTNFEPQPNPGQTFTLTTATDNIVGTNGNDTILGEFATAPSNTLNVGDQINGGAGTDTMKFYGAFNAAQLPATISNVEILQFINPGANDINSTQIASGVQKLQIDRVDTTGADRTFTTGNGTTLQLSTLNGATAGANNVNWTSSAQDTAATLVLDGFQGAGAIARNITITGAATTTLNVEGSGTVQTGATNANAVGTLTTAATTTKVNVKASSATDLGALTGANIATVDATGSTAGVTVNVNATGTTLKFIGGDGNDTVIFGTTNTFTTADSVDGGKGTNNTLGMATGQASNTTVAFSNIANFQTLRVSGAAAVGGADVINLDHFGTKNVRLDDMTNGRTVSNVTTGATLTTVAGTGTATLTIKDNGADDSLTVSVRGATGTANVSAAQFEKITLNASGMTGNLTLALTDPQLKELTVVNKNSLGVYADVAVDTGTLGPVVSKVDLSAFKAATVTNGVTVTLDSATAVNGATVIGSDNNDIINGSSQGDTITSGNGADTVRARGGNDTIDLTETSNSIDTVIFETATTNGTDTIKSFAFGTAGNDVAQLRVADTTGGATTGNPAVLADSSAALVAGGSLFVTGANTGTTDIVEITTTLNSAVTLSATSTGVDILRALSNNDTAAAGIQVGTASDKLFFTVYQNSKAFVFHGDSAGVTSDTTIAANEISLVGVFDGVTVGGFVSGDFVMIT